MGYRDNDLDPGAWTEAQHGAGAERLLLPGAFLPWDSRSSEGLDELVATQGHMATAFGATAVVAVDARWLQKRKTDLATALKSLGCPVALVPAAKGDPFALDGAIAGFRWVASRVNDISVLRTDHAGIGAVAFGAAYAAVGLRSSTRHFVPPGGFGFKKPSSSLRVFVSQLFDWYLADDIAGWSAAGLNLKCHLDCCGGRSVDRFLDNRLDVVAHNMRAVADLADYVLGAEREDRAALFLKLCRDAESRYGLAGVRGPSEPKAQLVGWVLS